MVRKTMFDKAFDFVDRVVRPKLAMAYFFTLALGMAYQRSVKRREERLNGYDYEERLNSYCNFDDNRSQTIYANQEIATPLSALIGNL
ncbi:hypothetical protein RHSIM_Rhsim12G0116100 [Rhododendron simsii]|uniref:Uncharacterized protein n=1 Tax=Rhododendron simsii TaxID=118357 RepID=A0A834G3S9_RHOSS|nr:hypothetical protein RHSIM_Rhsim12G0116100 [Rhododendron simsii]